MPASAPRSRRCKLCAGQGKISWEGKMAHNEPCPMCLGRRWTRCACCGGHFMRAATFNLDAPGDAGLVEALASLDGVSGGGPGGAGKKGRQQLIEQMDALANEIMTD